MSTSAIKNFQSFPKSSSIVAKDAEEKRIAHREKAMLVFAFQLLVDRGYFDTAASLSNECSINFEEFAICDNIDLHSIFLEFETYYQLRYQRYPQYFRKSGPNCATDALLEKMKANPFAGRRGSSIAKERRAAGTQNSIAGMNKKCAEAENSFDGISTSSLKLTSVKQIMEQNLRLGVNGTMQPNPNEPICDDSVEKLVKPISGLYFPNDEMRGFAEIIQKEIVMKGTKTNWEDVIGLNDAKLVLKEALLYSQQLVDFFGEGMTPWKGLLLYGPPGVGKTLLAKAVAAECGTTFFSISSSSIVSKWRGDSEKIVKVLFQLARYHAPSTIFFDEFDALGSSRDNAAESDPSRRLKCEILQQMDGVLSSNQNNQSVFILAATNLPWELDSAILRRLEKRIYVPLPNSEERLKILQANFQKTAQSVFEASKGKNSLYYEIDYGYLANKTDLYSGSDLHQIVKETVLRKFRKNYDHGTQQQIRQLAIHTRDVLEVISRTSPTVKPKLVEKFKNWESTIQPVV